MELSKIFNAKAIALNYTTAASNLMPYIGSGFFPAQKKAGLDLKWFKGNNGLPISLMPSTFDAKSTLRDRIGIEFSETEMPFFRESMLVTEKDEQEIMRIKDSNDPYAAPIIDHIFDDANTLIAAANVVPERMIMQLLAPVSGSVGISIVANGTNYTYNYDPNGTWASAHYSKIVSPSDKWTATSTSDPIGDIETALDAQETATGSRPEILLMSKATFNLIKNSDSVKSKILAQNLTATVNITSKRVTDYIAEELGVKIVVYSKQYKDESGVAHAFYPDNIVMMLPNGAVGTTWYGTTPEERTLTKKSSADVSIVNTGVAVAVTITDDPVNTKTTVSEIVLPSFERMNDCYCLEVA